MTAAQSARWDALFLWMARWMRYDHAFRRSFPGLRASRPRWLILEPWPN